VLYRILTATRRERTCEDLADPNETDAAQRPAPPA